MGSNWRRNVWESSWTDFGFDLIGTKRVQPNHVFWWARRRVLGLYELYNTITVFGSLPAGWLLSDVTTEDGFPYGVEVDPD